MDIKSTTMVSLLIAVSIASERLVEIIKGFVPYLNTENVDPILEGRRKSYLQLFAIVSGILTSLFAYSVITEVIDGLFKDIPHALTIIAIGLLASGGSGFWNSILTYLLKVKDIKEIKADKAKELKNAAVAMAKIQVDKAKALKEMEVEKANIEVESAKKILGSSMLNSRSLATPI